MPIVSKLTTMPFKLAFSIILTVVCLTDANRRTYNESRMEHKMSILPEEAKQVFCRLRRINYIMSARKNFIRAFSRQNVYQDGEKHYRNMQFVMRMEGYEAHSYMILVEEVLRELRDHIRIASAEYLENDRHIDIDLFIKSKNDPEDRGLVTRKLTLNQQYALEKGGESRNRTLILDEIFRNKIGALHPYTFDREGNTKRFKFWLFSVRYRGKADAIFYFKETSGTINKFKVYRFNRTDVKHPGFPQQTWKEVPLYNMRPKFNVIGIVQRLEINYMAMQHKYDQSNIQFVAFSMTNKYNITFLDSGTHWRTFFDCKENLTRVRIFYDICFGTFVILSYCVCLSISYEESNKSVSTEQTLQKKGWTAITTVRDIFVPKRFTQQVGEVTWINQMDKAIHHEYIWARIKEQFLEIFGETNFEVLERKIKNAENRLYGIE